MFLKKVLFGIKVDVLSLLRSTLKIDDNIEKVQEEEAMPLVRLMEVIGHRVYGVLTFKKRENNIDDLISNMIQFVAALHNYNYSSICHVVQKFKSVSN